MNNPLLAPAAIGLVLLIIALITRKHDEESKYLKIEAVCWVLSGSGFALTLLTWPKVARWQHDITGAAPWGLNLMLLALAWSVALVWHEALQRKARDIGGGHHLRTPIAAWLAGFSIWLVNFAGLTAFGVGVVLFVLSFIIAAKRGEPSDGRGEESKRAKDARKICNILAGLGGLGIGVRILEWVGQYRDATVAGLSVFLVGAAIVGTVVLFRNLKGVRYDPRRAPVWIAAFAVLIVLAGGSYFAGAISHATHSTVTTVDKVLRKGHAPVPGQNPAVINPMMTIGQDIAKGIDKKANGGHGG